MNPRIILGTGPSYDETMSGGRANKRLLEILTEHFNIPKSGITILKGTKTRNKTIQIILEGTADVPSPD